MRMAREVRDLMAPIEAELQGERAFALGQAGKKLELSLTELAAARPAQVDDLLHDAATAVWHYLIIRESLNMFDHADALKHYDVPPRVMAKVGVIRK